MKKFISIVLVVMMILSLGVSAFAAAGETGSITINNAQPGETYSVYKIFDVTYNEGQTAYSYTIAADSPWLADIQAYTAGEFTLTPATTGGLYVVTPKSGFSEEDAAAFAAYLSGKVSGKTPDGTDTVGTGEATAEFTGLDLGYYFVDTTLGSLCFLSTTNPSAQINEKNLLPTIDKTVQEDSTDVYGESNTAQIGDTVEFKTTINAYKGAENYVVHDKMSEGLSFIASSVVITEGEKTLAAGTDYTVVTDGLGTCDVFTGGCTFHIVFTQTYLNTITGTSEAPTVINIAYSAILNDLAAISLDANTNDTKLTYADDNSTETSHTDTYTYKFDLIKTDASANLLDGAEFDLYDAETDGNKIAIVKEEGGNYRIATDEETTKEGFVSASIVVTNGQAVVEGLDANTTYWLEETKAPAGYNKLPERVEVKMEGANLSATVDAGVWTAGGVHVVNNTGNLLPETGGIGTTIFYVIGAALMLGAAVLLITKRRMSRD